MKIIMPLIALLLLGGTAQAQCNKEITKEQKSRQVARLHWRAAGRTWDVALFWRTESVSDNGEEEATVVLRADDDPRHPVLGDGRVYHLTPDRCDLEIDPQLSTVKLMGRDFLLVSVPDASGSGSAVVAWMYAIDEKGHLTQVFHSVLRGLFMRGDECRPLVKSYIRADNADGTKISWVYESPDLEWVRKKADCKKAKIERIAYTFEWKNGCFPMIDPAQGRGDRLIIPEWDEEECVTGVGLVCKAKPGIAPTAASPDGGVASPDAGAAR